MSDVLAHSSQRFERLIDELRSDSHLNNHIFPGLADVLRDFVDPHVELPREELLRGMLKVFNDSRTDGTFSQILGRYEPDEEQLLREFVQGNLGAGDVDEHFDPGCSLGAREELPVVSPQPDGNEAPDHHHHHQVPLRLASVFSKIEQFVEKSILTHFGHINVEVFNDEGAKSKVPVYIDTLWQNWGQTVSSVPRLTFVPGTTRAVQAIVKLAKKHDLSVRASGYRHSWSPIFGRNGQISISTLGLATVSKLPNLESLPGYEFWQPGTELNSITFLRDYELPKAQATAGQAKTGAPVKKLVRVGTAVTNQKFRIWCNEQKLDKACSLPLNVIMVEISLGGSNAPICHGAGRSHPTLSDLVYGIEYIDTDGNQQTLDRDHDPDFMATAGGCFGLLGIVTHITLMLEPMSYAVMTPQKIEVMKAIPPPPGLKLEDIPEPLRITMTDEEKKEAQATFEKHVRDDFYAEWFWFPYTSKVWVNCWNTTDDGKGAVNFPSPASVFIQWAETVLMQILMSSEAIFDLQKKLPWVQTTLISRFALFAMPEVQDASQAIKTQLPNALHFRRAIQNVRVRDMEFEIPLQPKQGLLKHATFDDEIDYSLIQKAWWDAILTAYGPEEQKTCPQRMPLEMRITGPSNVTMSPFRGHNLGTCSIEILTLENMKDAWPAYAQKVLDKWLDLRDHDGNFLTTRPHWAKEWANLKVRNRPMLEYVKESYGPAIGEFAETLNKIAEKQGWNAEEARKRFSNDTFDQLYFGKEV